ncbi:DUF922 domain-containing protein [Niabella aurantiaca]|uniref:DUF922 domain-containing protein n=1 Tax=Niabella aurantiaca TaxID=379900 RepID=UPI0003601D11|nr:DUF922 domain-containing protein [Niabella aurantiaca]
MKVLLLVAGLFWIHLAIAQTSKIRWTASRVLQLSDFQILAKGEKEPARLEQNMSVTRTGFVYTMRRIGSGKNKGKTLVSVYAHMDPSNSYLAHKVLKESASNIAYLLNHEQRHFDISEIYARELSRYLKTQSLRRIATAKITEAGRRLFAELDAFQRWYDIETDHGRNQDKQEEWNRIIAQRLKALSPYARKEYLLTITP